jgi:hypothetical protein
MRKFHSIALTATLLTLACSSQNASSGTPAAKAPAATVPTTTATPTTTTTPTNTTTTGTHTLFSALGATVIANTNTITAPKLVSTGMTGITAFVPTQGGATYAWSVLGGTIPGVTQNAAVVFTAGAAGMANLQCTVTVAGVATTYTQDVPVSAALPATPFYYGSGFSADSLANTQVGGVSLNAVSYRFQAKHASPLTAIQVFFIWSLVKPGYHAGLGGTVQVDLMADDGTAAHLPTGPSLASVSDSHILSQNNFYPRLAFPYPATLKGGAFYHLVFTNTDPDPVNNFVSVDSLYTNAQTAPMQGCISDTAWAVLVKAGSGPWKTRMGFTPTLELEYADGGFQGNGYMEVWSTNPKTISGAASVRETFKVSGPSRTFSKVSVRLQRLAGTNPLTVRVEETNGTLIAEGTIDPTAILTSTPNWATVTFPLTYALSSGVAYNLVLSCPTSSQYSAFPMRKGGDKGFSNATYFPDGYAQFTSTGANGWQGWDMWGTSNLAFSDLQFMFVP